MTEEPARPGEIAQTLDRGLRLLEILAEADPDQGLSPTEAAARLGVHRSIAARLLATLLRRGFVRRTREGRYLLGMGLFTLARQVSQNLMVVAGPLLTEIAERLDATAVMHVADGDGAVTLASVEPKRASFHIGLRTGSRHPLGTAATGIAILAGRPAEADEREKVTQGRKQGYVVTTGELVPNFTGIAAPIVVNGWCDASVGVVIPKERKHDEKVLANEVIALAGKIAIGLS
ncbi:IclR family transcriptional regulator [Spongiactinospora rosea]|uniref:IclR family transcriptional regulator n=1 Tax=Spongiactinospora rosea TaxID=2248750 RepID=A0A366LPS7_9ACTN|nr:helix-turn-helix domain-containing protein [Spongiactinospora rosea]RBQ15908.1 IclR family transcriptional regulator [Spongiactinospora rosea]